MLSNEKYTGDVALLKNGNGEKYYLSEENNPAIISKEIFKAVQLEKSHRSNIVKGKNGCKRSGEKYSSKKRNENSLKNT